MLSMCQNCGPQGPCLLRRGHSYLVHTEGVFFHSFKAHTLSREWVRVTQRNLGREGLEDNSERKKDGLFREKLAGPRQLEQEEIPQTLSVSCLHSPQTAISASAAVLHLKGCPRTVERCLVHPDSSFWKCWGMNTPWVSHQPMSDETWCKIPQMPWFSSEVILRYVLHPFL